MMHDAFIAREHPQKKKSGYTQQCRKQNGEQYQMSFWTELTIVGAYQCVVPICAALPCAALPCVSCGDVMGCCRGGGKERYNKHWNQKKLKLKREEKREERKERKGHYLPPYIVMGKCK